VHFFGSVAKPLPQTGRDELIASLRECHALSGRMTQMNGTMKTTQKEKSRRQLVLLSRIMCRGLEFSELGQVRISLGFNRIVRGVKNFGAST
jgi:hypothetical protein